MNLEQIKNDYAVSKGFINWKYLQVESHPHILENHINEVMKIYAMECLKLASENFDDRTRSEITNENNLIK